MKRSLYGEKYPSNATSRPREATRINHFRQPKDDDSCSGAGASTIGTSEERQAASSNA